PVSMRKNSVAVSLGPNTVCPSPNFMTREPTSSDLRKPKIVPPLFLDSSTESPCPLESTRALKRGGWNSAGARNERINRKPFSLELISENSAQMAHRWHYISGVLAGTDRVCDLPDVLQRMRGRMAMNLPKITG